MPFELVYFLGLRAFGEGSHCPDIPGRGRAVAVGGSRAGKLGVDEKFGESVPVLLPPYWASWHPDRWSGLLGPNYDKCCSFISATIGHPCVGGLFCVLHRAGIQSWETGRVA